MPQVRTPALPSRCLRPGGRPAAATIAAVTIAAVLLLAAGCGEPAAGGADADADAAGSTPSPARSGAGGGDDSGTYELTVLRAGETLASVDQESGSLRDVNQLLEGIQIEARGLTVRVTCGGDNDPAEDVVECDELNRNNSWVSTRMQMADAERSVKCTFDDSSGPGLWRAEDVGGDRKSGSFETTFTHCYDGDDGARVEGVALSVRGHFEDVPIGEPLDLPGG